VLVETKRTSWTLFNQTVCALRFLYGTTLQRPGLTRLFFFHLGDRCLYTRHPHGPAPEGTSSIPHFGH